MCTVLYIPIKNGFIMSSNRDENPKRTKAHPPSTYQRNGIEITKPIVPPGEGTWLGFNSLGNFLILLNGADEKHIQKKSYRSSRGIVVSDLLEQESVLDYWDKTNLHDIEPFTLILRTKLDLFHLTWDGEHKKTMLIDTQKAHIWSSATLYSKSIKTKRSKIFYDWFESNKSFSFDKIHDFFHLYKSKNNGFLMNRSSKMKTISVTMFEYSNGLIQCSYSDLISVDAKTIDCNSAITTESNPEMATL